VSLLLLYTNGTTLSLVLPHFLLFSTFPISIRIHLSILPSKVAHSSTTSVYLNLKRVTPKYNAFKAKLIPVPQY
jgi:hypothetical protein